MIKALFISQKKKKKENQTTDSDVVIKEEYNYFWPYLGNFWGVLYSFFFSCLHDANSNSSVIK